MAKYVLLQFDDDAEADRFLEGVEEGDVGIGDGITIALLKFAVRGIWRKPTKFCECKTDMRRGGFRRGQKYGWWVHAKCGKPSRSWGRGDHWFLALGKNLLPVTDGAPEYRGDGVFARDRRKCPKCEGDCIAEIGHAMTVMWCPSCKEHV